MVDEVDTEFEYPVGVDVVIMSLANLTKMSIDENSDDSKVELDDEAKPFLSGRPNYIEEAETFTDEIDDYSFWTILRVKNINTFDYFYLREGNRVSHNNKSMDNMVYAIYNKKQENS